MIYTVDSLLIKSEKQHIPTDIDEILKESRKQALSEEKYLNEVKRIQKFISNLNKNNPNDEGFIDGVAGEPVTDLSVIFNHSQTLENTLCQYPDCFKDISDDLLSCMRVLDSSFNVTDNEGSINYLKQGDIIISYDSGCNEKNYILKSSGFSNRYIENNFGKSKDLNYKIISDSKITDNSKWLFIVDNFVSALAIYQTTGIFTIAIASVSACVLSELELKYPNKKKVIFSDYLSLLNSEESKLAKLVGISKGEGWACKRDNIFKEYGSEIGLIKFKDYLRAEMKDVLK